MRKGIFLAFSIFCVAVALSAQDMAAATVRLERTEPVSNKQLQQAFTVLEQQLGRSLSSAEKKKVLDEVIDLMLLVQAAEVDKSIVVSSADVRQAAIRIVSQHLQSVGAIPPGAILTDDQQYRQYIEQQGGSVEDFENDIREQLLAEKFILSRDQEAFQNIPAASPAELSAEYKRNYKAYVVGNEVWFKHIFFETKGLATEASRAKQVKANEVHRRLMNSSATFTDLVRLESDDEISKTRDGLIGPLMEGDQVGTQLYGADFIAKVFSLDVGDVSEVLKSNLGYHIVQITKKRSAQLLPEDDPEVKADLEQRIYVFKYQTKFEEVTQRIIKELRDKAAINYFGDYQ